MDKIVVNLYGGKGIFGGKETPLRAEEVYCDKYDKCSLFKNGCCLKVTSPSMSRCKFGKIERIQGYTSRAKKYYQFKDKYKSDDKYNKLSHPSNCRIALIDNYIYVNVTFTIIKYENDNYLVDTAGFCDGGSWIEKDKFDSDLLYKICNYRPYAMMGGEITKYKKECIPDMLLQLRKLLPELYNSFVSKYPAFDITPNYIGKYAYIKTLVKDSILIDNNGNKFIFDGESLICQEWKSSFIPFDARTSEMKIKVTEEMTYKISNNLQVDENTIFKQ